MDTAPKDVLLVITDISGYTRFMVANRKALFHAQTIIAELMQAIIAEVDIPLEISKLEGDAVFLYAIRDKEHAWAESSEKIALKLRAFHAAFSEKLSGLRKVTSTCDCEACRHVTDLKLKIVVHSGQALFSHVGKFYELSGPDVILAHRLLKNTVQADEYILFTEEARAVLPTVGAEDLLKSAETYDHFGTVPIYVSVLSAQESARGAWDMIAVRLGHAFTLVTVWLRRNILGRRRESGDLVY